MPQTSLTKLDIERTAHRDIFLQ